MSLLIRGDWFYGELQVERKRIRLPLDVRVRGRRPITLKLAGDEEFERARLEAQLKFSKLREEFTSREREASRLERIHELQTGVVLKDVDLSDLFATWRDQRWDELPSAKHIKCAEATFGRFVKFLKAKFPTIRKVHHVTYAMAAAFMEEEEKRGIADKTYDNIRDQLSAGFVVAARGRRNFANPFTDIPARENSAQFHRVPFTDEEATRILDTAARNPSHLQIIGPVTITAASTGMRCGDCARLECADVDLPNNRIRVTTAKNGARVWIPIFPRLRSVLEKCDRSGKYCFSAAAQMYEDNPDGLNVRFQNLLKDAGVEFDAPNVDPKIRRLRAPSLHGIHAFKTTFVTAGLSAGIPIALLQKILGNKVVEVVLENYFQPQEEELRRAFASRMPAWMTGINNSAPDRQVLISRLVVEVEELTAENCTAAKARMLAILASLRTGTA